MSDLKQERVEGTMDKVQGEAKEKLGKVSDDKETEAEGTMDQVQGKGKEGMADLKDKAGDMAKKVTGGN
jgi:uncharacterized protein YjbJ (UPF0337 family)